MTSTLAKQPSRTDVLEFVFTSSRYGNLGLFIGAGFSKAVLNTSEEVALSWGDLLDVVAKSMKVDYASLKREGTSFPEIASSLCRAHSASNSTSFDDSVGILKRALGAATAWYPVEPERSKFAHYLEHLNPSWIVTTNYDQVLECLLSGRSVCLGPNDGFSSAQGVIPIFHLHGARTAPDDIIITQEDYVALFRPAEYRQIRLALTIKESTTCLLGYGLGDVNVLTALDWSKNVYRRELGDYPHEVIQVFRTTHPKADPYRSADGIVIIEATEIADFCDEYVAAATKLRASSKIQKEQVDDVAALFASLKPATVNKFIDNQSWRRSVLKVLAMFSVDLIRHFEFFLDVCIKEIRARSSRAGAFEEYATNLNITLDILTAFPYLAFPPALFPIAASNLDRLSCYIGKKKATHGQRMVSGINERTNSPKRS